MLIEFVRIGLLVGFFLLFLVAILCITVGIKGAKSGSDSNLMPCGHPQSAARYADGDRGGTGYCIECVKAAERTKDAQG